MKRKLTVCLVAGVLILAVSAGAAFGSVNGYAAYKNGAKKLLLETDNVTLKGSYSISVDGTELDKVNASYAKDGKNWDSRSSKQIRGEAYETVDVMCDGVNSWYNSDMEPNTYYSYKSDSAGSDLLGVDEDSELENRMVTFLELAADTVVGDLKNNFVAIGKEDGVSRYQVDISKSQVPAVVNAGLSLMAYSTASSAANTSFVTHEDYDKCLATFYEQQTGKALSQELWENYLNNYNEEWAEANEDLTDEMDDVQSDFIDKYYDILEEKGDVGVIYVKIDGSYEYYASVKEFDAAHADENPVSTDRLNDILGEDMALETVSCTFAVDDQGRLTENSLTATFSTKDLEGQSHSLSLTANVTASDYGATKVQPLNLDGWTNLSHADD